MNKLLNWLVGFLFGSVISAVVVLLFLPRSGADTRQLIQGRISAVLEEGQQAAETRRHELTARFEALKLHGPSG